ncbi:CobW domain-containing protein [Rhizoctonia solani AG-1 IA]|uniref:CobW domain-containing protein n=1 Tax=Thanatephorus cucumeris (strain AG1-IA) TaxID=983506 RepID=L8WQE2_THACA|nr:CobW domain-containing protein [Rhizoctonia solani AG-1 IA]
MDSDDEAPLHIHRVAGPMPYLQIGKSTFLNLTEPRIRPHPLNSHAVAIIMNEFGDTADIEGRAISVSSPDEPASLATEFLELANGCLCCSVKDSGAAAIENLMRKQGAFDYLMLETTGLADPGPIAAMFWQNEDFSEDIALDGVVCVVDGVFGLKVNIICRTGLAEADVLLVNKMDLASSNGGDIQELEQQIRALNPTAPLIQTTHGRVDLSKVLNTGAYNSFKAGNDQKLDVHAHADDHTHDGDDCHQHDIESISSVQVAIPALSETQLAKLDEWIRLVLWEKLIPDVEVLRCKGIYHTENGKSYILQGVQTLYDVTELPESDSDIGSGKGKVVLIGRGLSKNITNNLQEYLGVL